MPYKPTGRRVGRPEKEDAFKPVSVKLPPDLLDRVKQYARIHQQSLSELIRDGLEWRISEGDIGYFRNTEKQATLQTNSGNTVILQEVKRLVERLVVVVGASESPAGEEVKGEKYFRNTVLPESQQSAPMGEDYPLASEYEDKIDNTVIQDLPACRQEKASSRRAGRPSSKREPILALLREHQEGLSAEQIRGLLSPEKPIGDTLQGLRRGNLVRTEGSGREMRYFLAS